MYMVCILLHDVHDVVVRGGVYHYTITKWSTKLSACVNTLRQIGDMMG